MSAFFCCWATWALICASSRSCCHHWYRLGTSMTDRIAATVRTTTRRVDTSRPPIDRTERPSPTGRVDAFFSVRLRERTKRRSEPSCFVARTRFFAEASSPFEDFAAFAAALR